MPGPKGSGFNLFNLEGMNRRDVEFHIQGAGCRPNIIGSWRRKKWWDELEKEIAFNRNHYFSRVLDAKKTTGGI